jgi:hypothetical protein
MVLELVQVQARSKGQVLAQVHSRNPQLVQELAQP